MSDEITPESKKTVVLTGDSPLAKAQVAAMLQPFFIAAESGARTGRTSATIRSTGASPKFAAPYDRAQAERDAWNAEVDVKKAAKKARKEGK